MFEKISYMYLSAAAKNKTINYMWGERLRLKKQTNKNSNVVY